MKIPDTRNEYDQWISPHIISSKSIINMALMFTGFEMLIQFSLMSYFFGFKASLLALTMPISGLSVFLIFIFFSRPHVKKRKIKEKIVEE
jgi:uncharacterized membrane protein